MKQLKMSLKYSDFKSYISNSFEKSPENYTIVTAMSGGVDSSVCASLIKECGYNTSGVTLKLSKNEITSCCSSSDIKDAQDVAVSMNFPHRVLDYSDNFKKHVVDDFIDEYKNGRTPSPCVRCNEKVKFGDLLDFLLKLGVDIIATGHYVMHRYNKGEIEIWRPKDKHKDQTYFLALVPKDKIQRLRFPLGIYTKPEVREIAADLDLVVATKKDSQDLCFVQSGSYRQILEKIAQDMQAGLFVGIDGEILGYHQGIHNYTVGQRKNIQVSNGPWFVLKIIPEENKVVIGRQEDLRSDNFRVDSLNLTVDGTTELLAQVRARHSPVRCILHKNTGEVELLEPAYAVAPGQICAFYLGDRLVGGGRIL